jgi:hypothetical protein
MHLMRLMRHATYLTRTPSPVDISLLAICLTESSLDRCETCPLPTFCSDAEKTTGLSPEYSELEEPSRSPRWSAKVCSRNFVC